MGREINNLAWYFIGTSLLSYLGYLIVKVINYKKKIIILQHLVKMT